MRHSPIRDSSRAETNGQPQQARTNYSNAEIEQWRSAKWRITEYMPTQWNRAAKNDGRVLLSTWENLVVVVQDQCVDDLLALCHRLDQECVAARSPLKLSRSYVRSPGRGSPESLHAGEGTVPALITFPSQTSCRRVIHHHYKSARCWKPYSSTSRLREAQEESLPSVPLGWVLHSHNRWWKRTAATKFLFFFSFMVYKLMFKKLN